MFDGILRLQTKWATKQVLAMFVVIYFIFPFYLLPLILPEGKALDLHVFYTASDAYKLIASYGEQNRQNYILGSATIDMVYPLCYATFLGLVLTFFLMPINIESNKAKFIRLFPYTILLADVIENICIITMLRQYPQQNSIVGNMAGIVTSIKWLLFFITLIMLLVYSIRYYQVKKPSS